MNLGEYEKDLYTAAMKMGLKINKNKTKYKCMKRKVKGKAKDLGFMVGGIKWIFKSVEQFGYSRVTTTSKNEENTEIKGRIIKGNKSIGGIYNIITSKNISRLV